MATIADVEDARLARIQRLADLLDNRFRLPLVGGRIGLDGLLGLVPGVGDVASALISGYLVLEAYRGGARKRVLTRMAWNVVLDGTLGAVPIAGDLFDFAFKANRRNARLAEAELRRGRYGQRR